MYGNIGKEAKKQKECCTVLLQCCGPLRVGKRGLQTLPRFCCWWLTIDYFFLPHFIQHFRSRRAMTGQRMSSSMERWGVKSFFAKQFFADLWTMICFCVFYRWRASGEFVSLRFFWNEVYKSLYVHTWIHLLLQTLHQNMLRVCTAYLSNRVWNVLKWSWALCCHYPKGSVPVFPYQSVKQSAWALGSPKQTHLICSWY